MDGNVVDAILHYASTKNFQGYFTLAKSYPYYIIAEYLFNDVTSIRPVSTNESSSKVIDAVVEDLVALDLART